MRKACGFFLCCSLAAFTQAFAEGPANSPSVSAAQDSVFGSWRDDRPGKRHYITLNDLPKPHATPSASNAPREVQRPANRIPNVPPGFEVTIFAEHLEQPRLMRTAPNGDIFVAETAAGQIRVLRPDENGALKTMQIFASDLDAPFGIAFYPSGDSPKWIYIAETNRVLRFAYQVGDVAARSRPEVIVPRLAPSDGGHVTRDIAFSADGSQMFVSVGSASNDGEGMGRKSPAEIEAFERGHALGAAWGFEEDRASVLIFTPDGKNKRIFATGIRNCVGLAVHPTTGDLYCSTNERDGLGDNLVPDYVTRVREGDFFGWPWGYMGGHEDPHWRGARTDLLPKIKAPDALIQPHSAPLAMTFYEGAAFPEGYQGSAFVALHGSWNRTKRTGYKVIRVLMRGGVPTGEYEDFLTGFVLDDARVYGRPVGVTVGKDGALYVSEDANGTVYRVSYRK